MTKIEKAKIRRFMDWVADGDSYVLKIPPHTTTDQIAKDLAAVTNGSKKHLSKKGSGILIIVTQYDERTKMPSIDGR